MGERHRSAGRDVGVSSPAAILVRSFSGVLRRWTSSYRACRASSRHRLRLAVARHRAADPRRGRRRADRRRDRRAETSSSALAGGRRRDPDELEAACPRRRSTPRRAACVVSRYGVGLDNIPVDHATELGILVTNVPDFCLEEVSDHAMALLLACARRVVTFARSTREGSVGPRPRAGPAAARRADARPGRLRQHRARARPEGARVRSAASSRTRRGATPARRATSS